jgi:hypothetical protein
MNSEPCRVHIIIDPLYGERLVKLPANEPVWVIDTEVNRPVIARLWAERKVSKHTDGITSFKASEEKSPEDILVENLSTIDLHHGEYSHDPPYSVLNVIGVTCCLETVREALNEYGFTKFEPTTEGFTAWKEAGQQDAEPDA